MLYKFKNGAAEEWIDGKPIYPMPEEADLSDAGFDLAALVNTFCAPLGIVREIEGE